MIMDDYSVRIVMPDEKIDFDHVLAMLEDEYEAYIMASDLEELAKEENW